MSQLQETSSLKRKRPESTSIAPSLAGADRAVLNVIKSKEDTGIWKGDIKRETNLPENVVQKALKLLLGNNLVKEVVNVKNKGKKHFMAVEFEPSKEISGGAWYQDGKLDKEFITLLKEYSLKLIRKEKVVTLDGVHEFFKKNAITKVECTKQQIAEILKSMVLDNEIIEVKSSGIGEYRSIRMGEMCYRCATAGGGLGQGPKMGAMASIPCGVCPRISQCTPDGIISPSTCVYYTRWLESLDLNF